MEHKNTLSILDNFQSDCEVVAPYPLGKDKPWIIQSAKQFNREVTDVINAVKSTNDLLGNILRDSISFSKYDGALDVQCLFIETREPSSTVHLVEGCIVGEEYIPLLLREGSGRSL